MEKPDSNEYNLPLDYYEIIRPYITSERTPITSRAELLHVWRAAIRAYKSFPEKKESIAEWTLSAGAGSLLIDEDPLLHQIHFTFGDLELPEAHVLVAPGETVDDRWQQLASLIEEAGKQ